MPTPTRTRQPIRVHRQLIQNTVTKRQHIGEMVAQRTLKTIQHIAQLCRCNCDLYSTITTINLQHIHTTTPFNTNNKSTYTGSMQPWTPLIIANNACVGSDGVKLQNEKNTAEVAQMPEAPPQAEWPVIKNPQRHSQHQHNSKRFNKQYQVSLIKRWIDREVARRLRRDIDKRFRRFETAFQNVLRFGMWPAKRMCL